VPAGKDGYAQLFNLDMMKRREKDPRHVAAWLARLIVAADWVCARAGGDGLCSMGIVLVLQGQIEGFLMANGIPAWGVPIVCEADFDRLRATHPDRLAQERGVPND
jgi:hypothetical protein